MIEESVSVVREYLVEIGFEAGKKFLKDKKEEKEIKEEIRKYIESERKYNELCNLDEEIDFEGILKYLQNDFMADISKRLFGNKKDRETARKTIINKAIDYSSASTNEAKRKIVKFVTNAFDILRNYYRNTLGKGELLLAAEIEDTITREMEQNKDELSQMLENHKNEIKACIDKKISFSMDSYLNAIQKNDFKSIETNLGMIFKTIGSAHPLYPDYKFHPIYGKNGFPQMISVPMSNEVYQKCPPRIVCKARIKVGDQYVKNFDTDIVDYANRHQLAIVIDISEAKKLLGDIEDPIQIEAEQMVGTTNVIPPKPFPSAFPCSIKINGKTMYEYIELRTKEILDDGTYIVTNEEQKAVSLRIAIKVNLISRCVVVNTWTINATNKELLQYTRFMKETCKKGKLSIHLLSSDINLIEGDLNDCDYKGRFATADEEILFYEKVVLLEEYFQRQIDTSCDIYEMDIESIDYMTRLISKESVELTWAGQVLTATVTLDEQLREYFFKVDGRPEEIELYGDVDINLFNEVFHLQIIRTLKSAAVCDFDQVKKKAEILENGDILKIRYKPGESDILEDVLDSR